MARRRLLLSALLLAALLIPVCPPQAAPAIAAPPPRPAPAPLSGGGFELVREGGWTVNVEVGGDYVSHSSAPDPKEPGQMIALMQYVAPVGEVPVIFTASYDGEVPPGYTLVQRQVVMGASSGQIENLQGLYPVWECNPPSDGGAQCGTSINLLYVNGGFAGWPITVQGRAADTLTNDSTGGQETREYVLTIVDYFTLYRSYSIGLGEGGQGAYAVRGWFSSTVARPPSVESRGVSGQTLQITSLGGKLVAEEGAVDTDAYGNATFHLRASLADYTEGIGTIQDTLMVGTTDGALSGDTMSISVHFCAVTGVVGNVSRLVGTGSVPLTNGDVLAPGDRIVLGPYTGGPETPQVNLLFADGKTAQLKYVADDGKAVPLTVGTNYVSGNGIHNFTMDGRDLNVDAAQRNERLAMGVLRGLVSAGLYFSGVGLWARSGVAVALYLADWATQPNQSAAQTDSPVLPDGSLNIEHAFMGDGALLIENRGLPAVAEFAGQRVSLPGYSAVRVYDAGAPAVQGLARPTPLLTEPLVLTPAGGDTVTTITPTITLAYPWVTGQTDNASPIVRLDGVRLNLGAPETGSGFEYHYTVPDHRALAQGPHLLEAALVSPSGWVMAQAEHTFTVDAPLPAPRTLLATAGQHSVGLRWTASPGDVGGYRISRSVDGGAYVALNGPPLAGTAYLDAALPSGSVYRYRVAAVDPQGRAGPESAAAAVSLATGAPAPEAPFRFTAQPAGDLVELAFVPGDSEAYAWRLERSIAANGPYVPVAMVTAYRTVDRTAPAGATYWYRLTPLAPDGLTGPYLQAGPVALADSAPAAPTGLSRTGAKETIVLRWDPAPEGDVAGYRVYRRSLDGAVTLRTPSLRTSPAFTDTLALDETFAWHVTAVDGTGHESAPSVPLAASARRSNTPLNIAVKALNTSGALVAGGAVEVTSPDDPPTFGSSVMLKAVPHSGFVFAGWSGGVQGRANPATVVLADDLEVTAQFALPALPNGLEVGTVAGDGTPGYRDGAAESARFASPCDVARGADGTLYVSDSGNHRIRLIAADGAVTTLAGTGSAGFADGPGSTAKFSSPQSVVTDAAGNLFVSDRDNNRIRKIQPDGTTSTLAGSGVPVVVDGTGTGASFDGPVGLSIDAAGSLYVTDRSHRVRRVSPGGAVTTIYSQPASGYTPLIPFAFEEPGEVAVAPDGQTIYVVCALSHAVRRLAMQSANTALLYPVAGGDRTGSLEYGSVDGPGEVARFYRPYGLALDKAGNLYVADTFNHQIRRVSPAGNVTTVAGPAPYPGFQDGVNAMLNTPVGLGMGADGGLYVADTLNQRIRRMAVMVEAGVTPALGGTLSARTSGVLVTADFPPGAVTAPVTLTWRPGDPATAPAGRALIGAPFYLEAHDAAGQPVTTFAQPFTLAVTWENAGLPADTMQLFTWNAQIPGWEGLPTNVDAVARRASTSLYHLSLFALMQERTTIYLPLVQ